MFVACSPGAGRVLGVITVSLWKFSGFESGFNL